MIENNAMREESTMKSNSSAHRRLFVGGSFLLALAMLLSPAAAHAQDGVQTVESAQRFLSQIIAQQATRLDADVGNGWNRFVVERSFCRYYTYYQGAPWNDHLCGDNDKAPYEHRDYSASEATSPSRCSTVLQATSAYRTFGSIEEKAGGRNFYMIWPKPLDPPFTIDWTKVAEVKQDESFVSVRGVRPAIRFKLASEALATRMAYAMEFIRTSCDATADTGF